MGDWVAQRIIIPFICILDRHPCRITLTKAEAVTYFKVRKITESIAFPQRAMGTGGAELEAVGAQSGATPQLKPKL